MENINEKSIKIYGANLPSQNCRDTMVENKGTRRVDAPTAQIMKEKSYKAASPSIDGRM
jgi:hypothetical protein